MTADELKIVNQTLKSGKIKTIEEVLNQIKAFKGEELETTEEVLMQIADELRFAPVINSLFITEVNYFLHHLHRLVGKTDYYDGVAKDFHEICTLSMHLSNILKETEKKPKGRKTLSKSLISDMKTIGVILHRIAPSIRSVAALIVLLESSDIQMFG